MVLRTRILYYVYKFTTRADVYSKDLYYIFSTRHNVLLSVILYNNILALFRDHAYTFMFKSNLSYHFDVRSVEKSYYLKAVVFCYLFPM